MMLHTLPPVLPHANPRRVATKTAFHVRLGGRGEYRGYFDENCKVNEISDSERVTITVKLWPVALFQTHNSMREKPYD